MGYIGDIPDFRYDTKSKKFYTESSICHERTTTELNQAASALRLFEGISFDEILNLCNILYENPYFAAYTNIGKRVYQIIRDWPVSMTFDEPYYYRARINKFYLSKIFKETYGTTINNYLISKRITRAKQLLRFTDMTVDEIGVAVGMADANYFSRMFRKVEGSSPREYRKQW